MPPTRADRTVSLPPQPNHPESGVKAGSGEMFDAIAPRYDFLNRVLSLGRDRSWRKQAVAALGLGPGSRVLDVACGTGDVLLAALYREPAASGVGLDPSRRMLQLAQHKAIQAGQSPRMEFCEGDALALPFPDRSFDATVIAFGIRNVPDRGLALTEMARVTRPGGRVVVLELSEPHSGALRHLARFYIRQLVPRIGGLLSSDAEYCYLKSSILDFPRPDQFAALMVRSGLRSVSVRPLTFGVCTLFVGSPGVVTP